MRLAFAVLLAGCTAQPLAGVAAADPPLTPPGMGPDPVDMAPGTCTSTAGLSEAVPDGPPPISGGTLIVLPGGNTAVASDPDFDDVWIADLTHDSLGTAVALQKHDEPGRLVADAAGQVHVVLRRAGAIATVDPVAATVLRRDDVCPAPRGIAYDAAQDQLLVACAGGELVTLPAAGGAPVRSVFVDDDLRDVLIVGGTVMVTRFRSAELLTLDASGSVASRTKPGDFMGPDGAMFTPSVAWRAIPTPNGGVAVVHQRGTTATIDVATVTGPGNPPPSTGYGDVNATACMASGPVVHSVVSVLTGPDAQPTPGPLETLPLGVDVAVSPDGTSYAVVSGTGRETPSAVPSLAIFPAANIATGGDPTCNAGFAMPWRQPVAVAALDNAHFVVQLRSVEVAVVDLQGNVIRSIELHKSDKFQLGQDLFNSVSVANVACASCHPEGGDDGRVWSFDIGLRRTMPLRGGIRGTEPLHWNGDEDSFALLMADVFTNRMHAGPQSCDAVQSVANWVESLPTMPRAPGDAAAIARGKTLFETTDVGCANCHNGPHFTNNINSDVGTGGFFNVPRLVDVASHAPYFHDGRAKTLRDRFDPTIGGGDMHGNTSQLTSSEIDDLVAYLSSL
jgi:mono/diheme cytochrome c family protein